MSYFQILVLAVIQGFAELLPVSSSAHVIFAERLMGLDPSSPDLTFLLAMLHTGTMFAVLVYFWPRWRALLVRPAVPDPDRPTLRHFVLMILLASMLTVLFGGGLVLFIERIVLERMMGRQKGEVEELFRSLPLIGSALMAAGIIILCAGYWPPRQDRQALTWANACWIGWIQGLSLPFRGFSRSGVTISMGLMRGVSRSLSEEFSFALALVITPPVIGRYALRLLKDKEWQSSGHLLQLLTPGLLGMVLSCLAGLLALRLLSAMLEKGRWQYFGYYCVGAAGVLFAAAYAGW